MGILYSYVGHLHNTVYKATSYDCAVVKIVTPGSPCFNRDSVPGSSFEDFGFKSVFYYMALFNQPIILILDG